MTMGIGDELGRLVSADYSENVRIKQNRGPTIEFKGKLLASTEWETRDGQMRLELYQSRGGALIPVTRTDFEDGRRALVSASVIESDPNVPEVNREADMRFAVLDHFDWNDRAKSMVRQQLGWKLTQVVE